MLVNKNIAFEELSVVELSDICGIEYWNLSISTANEIYDMLNKQIKLLVVPSVAIETLTADLSERDKYIIENRYLNANKTLEELGSELGLTRERVRQITVKVERKFKASRKRDLIKAIFNTLKVLCECEHCFTINELNRYKIAENALIFLSEILGNKMLMAHIPETDCVPHLFLNKRQCNPQRLNPPITVQFVNCVLKKLQQFPTMITTNLGYFFSVIR